MTPTPQPGRKAPPPPNGTAQKEDRALAIAEAALEVFLENGYAGTKLDEVATRAGIAKGTIYLYFDSKEALFEAAVTSRLGPFFDQAEVLIDQWDGPAADLIAVLGGRFQALMESETPPRLIRLILAEAPSFPGVAKRYHEAVISRGMRMIRRIIAYGVERGEWRETRLGEFPQLVVAPMVLAAIWKVTFSAYEPLDLKSFIDTHISLLLAALEKDAA